MGNTRNQKFVENQPVVTVRDILVEDLAIRKGNTAVVVKAGSVGTVVGPSVINGNIYVSWSTFDRSVLNGTGIRNDGRWSIDRDLIQPFANRETHNPSRPMVVPFDAKALTHNTIPAGSKGQGKIDSDGDIHFSYTRPDGRRDFDYVAWYKLVPDVAAMAAAEQPEEVFGKAWGRSYSFSQNERIMLVATRDVTVAALHDPNNMGNPSDGERVFLKAGQIGVLRALDLSDRSTRFQFSVAHYDHRYSGSDWWNFAIKQNIWVPLLNLETGKPMTYGEFMKVEEKSKFFPVGEIVTINSPVYVVEDGELTETVNYAFRDDDEVYILQVDTDVDPESRDALIYKVGHFRDGSGITTWLRPVDLYESANDE